MGTSLSPHQPVMTVLVSLRRRNCSRRECARGRGLKIHRRWVSKLQRLLSTAACISHVTDVTHCAN
ncbi:hypothetical protein JOB18_015381 [Solea senegalensis]|uniref:Uncharacterized protein n=1 Tax=Solea senegalensis TaxID=28829 RepID=A0AAV6S7W0_SOLSE|nr:hypothetical protein JOB18_015381 [Solea senegalensis]